MAPHPLPAAAQCMLNVGLAIGTTGQRLTLTEVVQAVERAGLVIDALAVHDSATEPTAVIRATVALPAHRAAGALYGLAITLAQDCIAVHWLGRGFPAGALIGPAADMWGAFNPAFFLTLDGSPLVDSQPAAA